MIDNVNSKQGGIDLGALAGVLSTEKTKASGGEVVIPEAKSSQQDGVGANPIAEPSRLNVSMGDMASLAAMLGALIVQASAEQREQNRQEIRSATEANIENLKSQASELREKATDIRNAAIASGVAQIASGAMSIVGGSVSVNAGAKSIGMTETMAKATMMKGAGYSAIAEGAGSVFGGVGKIVEGEFNASQVERDAKIKELEAGHDKNEELIATLKSYNEGLKDVIDRVLSAVQSMTESSNQARAKILG
jgi:uncharacterized phage infection (PIP) family protein YhgE